MKKSNILSPFGHRIIVATGILLFSIIYLIDIETLKNSQDKLLVNPVIWIIIILYPIILWQEWREWKREKEKETLQSQVKADDGDEEDETSAKLTKKIFYFMVSTMLYLALMNYLGFAIMTLVFMPVLLWILGTKSKRVLIFLPIITTFVLFMLFDYLLGIPLPLGTLFEGGF